MVAPKLWTSLLVVMLAASISCGQYRAPDLTVGSPDQWQMVDLPGVSGGSRAAAYDPGRDCLWILTRYFRQAGHPQVSLTQLNVRTHAATSIPLSISAAGFIQGSIIVDPSEHVWMSWGRNLVAYDPSDGLMGSWVLPAASSASVVHTAPQLDGNSVAMSRTSDGEVWVVAHGVQAAFGFNAANRKWDRMVNLSLSPYQSTRLAAIGTDVLALNGLGAGGESMLGSVTISTGQFETIAPSVVNFVVVGSGAVVYEDGAHGIDKIDLASRHVSHLRATIALAQASVLSVDPAGNAWVAVVTLKSVGLARIDTATGSADVHPFPPIPIPSGSREACLAQRCQQPSVLDPSIQSIVFDKARDVWVITAVPGTNADPNLVFRIAATPVYELTAAY